MEYVINSLTSLDAAKILAARLALNSKTADELRAEAADAHKAVAQAERPPVEEEAGEKYTTKAALEAARRDAAAGEADDVALLDAQWLLKFDTSAGGPPCRQQLPADAFFAGSVDADDVEVLSISYPWLTKEHPDPEGWHLKIVQHFLRLYFTMEGKGLDEDNEKRVLPPEGEGKRVAIFWDWMSLHQQHNASGRTAAQTASFITLVNH